MKVDLMNGDCLEVMKNIPDESIDMIITSPPYDNLRTYNNSSEWSFDIFKNISLEMTRILKEGGVIVWVVGDATVDGSETGSSFRQALHFKDECGLRLHDTMIWEKSTAGNPSLNRYHQIFEYMFVFSKGKPKTYNPIKDRENKYAGHVLHGTYRKKNGETKKRHKNNPKTIEKFGQRNNIWKLTEEKVFNKLHPAVFPISLAKDHILTWSNEGDIVLDIFMGSGTTGIACLDTGRNFIGIEIDENYFNVSKNRIDEKMNEIEIALAMEGITE